MAILITYLILGGGSSSFLDFISDTTDAVKTVVIDDERQDEALSILKSMKTRSKEHNKQDNESSDGVFLMH